MSILPASGIGDESTGFYTETINQSLRFDGSSSELNITPSSTGNRRTFTTSLWVKRSKISSAMEFHTGGSNSSGQLSTQFGINSSDQLQFYDVLAGYTNYAYVRSSNILRDTTNWYHIVLAVDTTQSTASDRVKLYLNGSEVSYVSSPTYPDQNHQTVRNYSGTLTRIGRFPNVAVNYFNGYIAEFNHIDGTALDPTSFGETKNGVWIPKAISGLTYGTNGFRLTFADSSSLGDDTSGNGNDYTSSGLASSDVVADSPSNNFCVMNPLDGNSPSLTEGSLKVFGDTASAVFEGSKGTFGMSSGKWYWEMNAVDVNNLMQVGITPTTATAVGSSTNLSYHTDAMIYQNTGTKRKGTGGLTVSPSSASNESYGNSYTDGDIIGVALDLDSSPTTLTFYKNGSSEGTAFSSLASDEYLPLFTGIESSAGIFNFGQDGTFAGTKTAQGNSDGNGQGNFYYTPPSGYLALCSSNLPEVTISPSKATQGDDHFNTVLYTGNGTGQTISGVGFQPDWTWNKNRDQADFHILQDSVRGAGKEIFSNSTADVETYSTSITSFNTDGFVLGSREPINANNEAYVSYNWKAGGAPSADNSAGAGNTPTSNSVKIDGSNLGSALAGTIPATRLSANTTAGFSIVTYTGTGSAGTLAHGLTSAPEMIWFKQLNADNDWMVYNKTIGNNRFLYLNLTNGQTGTSSSYFDDTDPSSTVISLKDYHRNNDSSDTYVAYAFHSVDGYSKIGTYTGNGDTSADGAYVFLGFRPQWVLIKRTDSSSGWLVWNNKVSTFNPVDDYVAADSSAVEQTGSTTQRIDFLSNGFKAVNTSTSNTINGSGTTHIYMAFAEQPFKFSNAR